MHEKSESLGGDDLDRLPLDLDLDRDLDRLLSMSRSDLQSSPSLEDDRISAPGPTMPFLVSAIDTFRRFSSFASGSCATLLLFAKGGFLGKSRINRVDVDELLVDKTTSYKL